MSKQRKTFIVITLGKGRRELQAMNRDAAWKAATARGWLVLEVYEKEEAKKAA